MRRMRVLHVITRGDQAGGAQVHVANLAAAQVQAGDDVSIATGSFDWLGPRVAGSGVACLTVPSLKRQVAPMVDLCSVVALRRLIRHHGPEIVASHSTKAGALCRLATIGLRTKVVHTVHGWSFGRGRPLSLSIMSFVVELGLRARRSHVIAVSNVDRDLGVRTGVVPSGRCDVVHNALPDIARSSGPKVIDGVPTIVMVGRFAQQKDHQILLDALVLHAALEWRLVLVGDGPLQRAIQDHAVHVGLRDRVEFKGSLTPTEVVDVLASADLFVLASRFEGLPIVILEAMRAGLPVVASDVGGVSEAVLNGSTGELVAARNAESLSTSIGRYLVSPSLRQRHGCAARERYEQHFTMQRLVTETAGVYARALQTVQEKQRSRAVRS
jgi:glycosyltransferase involved in cell wall biosynthesis